jgi:hypothetical protein
MRSSTDSTASIFPGRGLACFVLHHSQTFAACDDFVGRTPRSAAAPLVDLLRPRKKPDWLRLRCFVGQAILPAAAFQAALPAMHVRVPDPSGRRLKAGCSQDWLRHGQAHHSACRSRNRTPPRRRVQAAWGLASYSGLPFLSARHGHFRPPLVAPWPFLWFPLSRITGGAGRQSRSQHDPVRGW